jgi:acyl-CoA synthetase (AMP-forming)/AMP-acid ligase II/thioesterase domain-containing protein/acyl carrier protein
VGHLPFPREALASSIHACHAQVARRHADRPAVDEDGNVLTHAELARRAARATAWALRADEGPLGLLVEDWSRLAPAFLGVLAAGRVFVPLDPRTPEERLRTVTRELGVSALLADAPDTARALGLPVDAAQRVLEHGPAAPDDLPAVGPEEEACILVTSGSTGTPKGVLHTHASLLHNVLRHVDAFRLAPTDRHSQVYPPGVYGGLRDALHTLLVGATLCPYPLARRGIAPLPAWLVEREITVLACVATVFRQLVPAVRGTRFPRLRLLKLGGEAVHGSDVAAFQELCEPGAQLSCGLGSTETGATRQHFLATDAPVPPGRVSCGHAVPDVEVRIVDERGAALPDGEVGEIVVRSRYLAAGYARRPELDRARLTELDDGRCDFRTGDLGRLGPDGALWHLGRADRQVQVKGNRVEPGEIEEALLGLGSVSVAAVVPLPREGTVELVAHVVPSGEPLPGWEAALRRALSERLPASHLPARCVAHAELPTLPNGKVDLAALAELPDAREPRAATGSNGAPRTPTEEVLAELWGRELGPEALARTGDFFDLGGDSLAMMRLLLGVEERLGVRLPPWAVTDAPTLASLSAHIDAHIDGRDDSGAPDPRSGAPADTSTYVPELVPLRTGGSRPPLVLFPPAGGSLLPYYALVHALGPDQPVVGVRVHPPERRRLPELSLEELGGRCAELLRSAGTPRHLAGWSFGGFLAFETARRLEEAGTPADSVSVIDSQHDLIGAGVSLRRMLSNLVMALRILWHTRSLLRSSLHLGLARRRRAGERLGPGARLLWRLGLERSEASALLADEPRLLSVEPSPARMAEALGRHIRSIREYRPGPYRGDLDVLVPTRGTGPVPTLGWERATTGAARAHAVGGTHFDVCSGANVAPLAATLRAIFARDAHASAERVPVDARG